MPSMMTVVWDGDSAWLADMVCSVEEIALLKSLRVRASTLMMPSLLGELADSAST